MQRVNSAQKVIFQPQWMDSGISLDATRMSDGSENSYPANVDPVPRDLKGKCYGWPSADCRSRGARAIDGVVSANRVRSHRTCRRPGWWGGVKGCLSLLSVILIWPALASPGAASFKTLAPVQCVPLAQAGYNGRLTAEWSAFKPYLRACPLATSSKVPARLWLLTVFAQRYLDDHPDEAAWPDFPRPLLVTPDGHCLARLPELFPFDEPRSLHLQYGTPVNGMPGEIRVHVSHPAAGGDYDLPVLRWVPGRHAYVAQNDTGEYTREDMTCRN